MGEEIAFENGRISDFQGLVTLTLDRVILHTVMHLSSTSIYIPNFIEIEETFCGRTDGRTFETHFIRSTLKMWDSEWVNWLSDSCESVGPFDSGVLLRELCEYLSMIDRRSRSSSASWRSFLAWQSTQHQRQSQSTSKFHAIFRTASTTVHVTSTSNVIPTSVHCFMQGSHYLLI